ncbi:MAG: GNAT family N-acetyltransferase [Alphaproteobacteria bacterium]|nr:GNAT family N-acetyltransferase [Alphaproteobacteria bacterium]
MSVSVDVFDATAPYASEIGAFVVSIQHEHGVPITLEQQPDLFRIHEVYIATGGNFWVASDGDKVVGTIALINVGGGIGVLRKMFVAPAYRGTPHRLGQQLLDGLMAWAKQQNFKHIYLGTVDILKAAQRFYEKNGFCLFPESDLPTEIAHIKMPDDNLYYAKGIAA